MGTITKALNLLNFFSDQSPELGLTEFTRLTRQDKATVHRHLSELEANGFLEQNPQSRKYRLGGAILRLSAVRERTFPARRIVSRSVDRLSAAAQELVHASLIQNDGMSPLYFHDGGVGGTRVYFSEADMLPFHATASGLAALAFGSPAILDRVLASDLAKFTQFTTIDKDGLLALVKETSAKGYAEIGEAYEREVCSIAAPFYHDSEQAYGTIAIAVPASRMDETTTVKLVGELLKTCRMVSDDLGGSIPVELNDKWSMAA